MKQDTKETYVDFKIHKTPIGEKDDLFAYFPNEIHNSEMNVCYSHIGQHGGCSPEYAAESRYTKPKQYKDLKKELESIGYKLKVAKVNQI